MLWSRQPVSILSMSIQHSTYWEANQQLVQEFPVFYWIGKYITLLTTVCLMPLSCATLIQPPTPYSTFYARFLWSYSLSIFTSSGFPTRNLLFSLMHSTCPNYFNILNLIISFHENYETLYYYYYYYYYYLLQLSFHSVAVVLMLIQTKQISVNIHKRNNKKHSTNNPKHSKYKYTYFQSTQSYTHPHITK